MKKLALIALLLGGCSTSYMVLRIGVMCFNVNSQCVDKQVDKLDAGQ